jgi:2-phospho-L-lactate/phosphoenolpyruvate guanylyltransferase
MTTLDGREPPTQPSLHRTPTRQEISHQLLGDAASTHLTAIIPAKALDMAKSRLTLCLTTEERMRLSHHMLLHTIRVARSSVDLVFVISRDLILLEGAEAEGAIPIKEQRTGLNAALRQAAAVVCSNGAQGILVLPSDLPLITVDDVRGLSWMGSDSPSVVISPSWRDGGTNALLIRPSTLDIFSFGHDSFARHSLRARQHGLEPKVFRSETLAFDLDTSADWTELCARTDSRDIDKVISLLEATSLNNT